MHFELFAGAAFGLSALVVFALRSIPSEARRKARKAFRAASPLTAESADGELVYVTGTVKRASDILKSPLTDTKCIAYRLEVTAGSRHLPAAAFRAVDQHVAFELECDDLGRISVEPVTLAIDLPPRRASRWDHSRRNEVLRSLGFDYATNSDSEEIVVEVGARISVVGTLTVGAPRDEYGAAATTRRLAATAIRSPR